MILKWNAAVFPQTIDISHLDHFHSMHPSSKKLLTNLQSLHLAHMLSGLQLEVHVGGNQKPLTNMGLKFHTFCQRQAHPYSFELNAVKYPVYRYYLNITKNRDTQRTAEKHREQARNKREQIN